MYTFIDNFIDQSGKVNSNYHTQDSYLAAQQPTLGISQLVENEIHAVIFHIKNFVVCELYRWLAIVQRG